MLSSAGSWSKKASTTTSGTKPTNTPGPGRQLQRPDTIAGYEEIPYYPPDESARREEHIYEWSVAGAVRSGIFVHTDFDCRAPRKRHLAGRNHPHEQARTDLEIFDYPGGYTKHAEGDDWRWVRIEELHVDYRTARGKDNARGLTTGGHFKLTNEPASFPRDPFELLDPLTPRQNQDQEYLVVSANGSGDF